MRGTRLAANLHLERPAWLLEDEEAEALLKRERECSG